METLENQLKELRFAPPPRWLKARALVAAQNAHLYAQRRKGRWTTAAAVAAAAVLLAATANYFLVSFGIIRPSDRGPAVEAGPVSPGIPETIHGLADAAVAPARPEPDEEVEETSGAQKDGEGFDEEEDETVEGQHEEEQPSP